MLNKIVLLVFYWGIWFQNEKLCLSSYWLCFYFLRDIHICLVYIFVIVMHWSLIWNPPYLPTPSPEGKQRIKWSFNQNIKFNIWVSRWLGDALQFTNLLYNPGLALQKRVVAWVLRWMRETGQVVWVDTFFNLRTRPHVSGYFWIQKLFFRDMSFVHTHLVNPTCKSGHFWVHSPEWKLLNPIPFRICECPEYPSGCVWGISNNCA